MFLGGVAHRYPTLNFGFMEGGVSWACQMVNDMIEHWEKRTRANLQYPNATNVAELKQYIHRYGDARLKANADKIMDSLDAFRPECSVEELSKPEHVTDDFDASGVKSKADIRNVFANNFFFGCEADDRATMWAFDPRMGVRLRPVFSSDITHFDVPDFADVIPEAYEMLERHYVTEQDFRGKLMLIYFGFVFCPDACPTALANMTDAVELLGPAGDDVTPVFISVDPERDTVEVLKDYAEAFHPRLKALTGTMEEIQKVAKEYRMYFKKAAETAPGEYLVDHSSIVFLMSREGRYLTHFTHMTLPEPMAAEIKKRL